jgi:hypothetical protein
MEGFTVPEEHRRKYDILSMPFVCPLNGSVRRFVEK